MSYTVSFGTINKRVNSTSQSYTEALSASCLLKETTDILRPTVSIAAQIAGDSLLPCNYMYIAAFGRYYWITGMQFVHGSWYVSGEVDVLASYKSAIGTTTAYVLRAASDHNDRIADGFYTLETVPTGLPSWEATEFDTTGTIVVSVLGNDGSDSYCYYAMYPSTWTRLYSVMYNSNFLNSYGSFWSNIATDIFNTIINPGDYVSSAIWLPVKYDDIAGTPTNIWIANFQTAFLGKHITPNTLLCYKSKTLALPDHPQEATNGVWMRGNRCSRDELLLPGYGTIVLDSDVIAAMAIRSVSIQYAVDCTGAVTYHINYGGKYVYCNANIGTPCGFGDIRPDFSQAVASVFNAGVSALHHNFAGAVAGIVDATMASKPQVERISSGGSRTLPTVMPYFYSNSTFYLLPADAYDNAGSGRPLSKTVQLSTLSGYIMCASTASVSCPGTQEEIERVNSYLTGGFYYE